MTQQARSLGSLREVVLLPPPPISSHIWFPRRGKGRRRAGESAAQCEVKAKFSGCAVMKSVWSRCWKEKFLSPYMPPHQGMLGMPGVHSPFEQRRLILGECNAPLKLGLQLLRLKVLHAASLAFPGKWCLKHVARVIVVVGCQSVAQKSRKPSPKFFLITYMTENLYC